MEETSLQKNISENKHIEAFQLFLNKEPENSAIKTNTLANNSKYLSIGFLENKLDEIYSGLWSVEKFEYQTLANEIIGSLELKIFHPVAQIWITRIGSAGKPITFKKDSDISVISNKQKNAMVTVMPALKAECLKNACKSLGVLFGRNLNRENEDYEPISEQVNDYDENQNEVIKLLETAKIDITLKTSIKSDISKASPKKIDSIIEFLKTKQK